MHIIRKPSHRTTKELLSMTLLVLTLLCVFSLSVMAKTISDPYQLSANLQVFGDVLSSRLSNDGQYLVYVSDQEVNAQQEVFSVRVTGGEVIKLNSQFTILGSNVDRVEISPDSQWVVYRADSAQDGRSELFSVPIGGGTPVRLNANLPNGGDVDVYSISPDSSRVVYTADQIVNDRVELFSVPISGGSVQRLNSELPLGGNVERFLIGSQNARVVYIADRNTDGDNGLYSSALVVGGASLLSATRNVLDFKIRPDAEFVAFRAQIGLGAVQLYRVAIIGGFVLRLNPTLPDGGNVGSFQISADGARVVYLADQNTNGVTELFLVLLLPLLEGLG